MIENNSESNHGPSGDGNRMNMDETAARSTDTPNLFHVWEKKESFLEQHFWRGKNQVLAKVKA